MLNRFLLSMLVACLLVSCGDDSSGSSSTQPVNDDSANEELSSDSEVRSSSGDALSSAKVKRSSSSEAEPESSDDAVLSSSEDLQSSPDEKKSSSSSVMSSSSADSAESSSSAERSSSSVKQDESSSSAERSSSSVKLEEYSSSSEDSSSSDKKSSSSSEKSSSSSAKSSSSSDKSSSSSVKSSSSSAKSSSSSLGIPFEIYDCSEHKCVTTIYLNPNIEYGEFLDTRDDQVYRTVKIGEQTWMAQNLNYKMEGSRCLRQDKSSSDSLCFVYGRLYTWNAANNACPIGWRLPSDEEDYKELSDYVKEHNHGMAIGTSLKAGKNDIWGFSGMFSGYRTRIGAETFDHEGYYWTNEEKDSQYAFGRLLDIDEDYFGWITADKEDWLAVRCIKD